VLFSVGSVAILAGLFFLAQQRFRLWRGVGLLASILLILGVAFLATAMVS
jgi:hypothetical protein